MICLPENGRFSTSFKVYAFDEQRKRVKVTGGNKRLGLQPPFCNLQKLCSSLQTASVLLWYQFVLN